MDIEVVERAAADAAALYDVDAFENLVLQKAEALFLAPKRLGDFAGGPRKVGLVPLPPAFEETHGATCLREAAGGNRSAETGADHDDVVGFVQFSPPINRVRVALQVTTAPSRPASTHKVFMYSTSACFSGGLNPVP